MNLRRLGTVACALALTALIGASAAEARTIKLREYRVPDASAGALQQRFADQILSRYPEHTWAPMRFELSNRDLALMGLPSKRVLFRQRYRTPTAFYSGGRAVRLGARKGSRRKGGGSGGSGSGGSAEGPGVVSFAGTGFFGIRPGAWLLFIDENSGSVGWCTMAHVYGSPGSYEISTAGHCGKPGEVATVIGVVGNHTPVLIDFGTFKTSHDGGLGNDWALISISPQWQNLVTPTMAFWGGPIGMYTSQGELVDVNVPLNGKLPSVTLNPNPALAQQIVHYGHGLGVGAGGTPRSGTAIAWGASHFMFFGAIVNGDSGSGANTLAGDATGDNREAAGIITHIWVDPLMRQGLGIMGGTRATQVAGTLANGQVLPYPAPVPAAP
jgi:hypothetical protein